MRTLVTLVGAIASLSLPARAEMPSAPSRSVVGLGLDGGIGTPLGQLSASLELRPIRWLSLGAGGGFSLDGAQLGAMARIEPDLPAYLGLGTSFGRYMRNTCSDFGHLFPADGGTGQCPKYEWDRARWLNIEGGYTSGFREDVRLRAYLGIAVLLNRTPSSCTMVKDAGGEEPCATTNSAQIPTHVVYFGLGMSWPP